MSVTVDNKSTVRKVLHIEIPEVEVSKELDSAYRDLKKTASVKGFRPGKTPRSVLERIYGKSVDEDVSSRLLQSAFVEAVRENDLKIVGEPDIDMGELKAGTPFKVEINVEVRPEIAELDFKGLELKKVNYGANEEEVTAQLEMLRKNIAKKEPIKEERPVLDGDFVLIDSEGFKDGEPYDATPKNANSMIKVGAAPAGPEFDKALVGMVKDEEKTIEIAYPEDFLNKELAGMTISYQVKLIDIREEVLPEIDDEFAKSFGPFESLEDLKKKILENLESGYAKRSEQEMNEQVFGALIEKTEFEIPETMVKFELDHIIADAEKAFASSNMSLEQVGKSKDSLAEEYREVAEKQVRRHLILGKLIEQEKLDVTEEELEEGYKEMSASFGQPVEAIKAFYSQNPDKIEYFKHTLLEKKAIQMVVEHGKVEEVEPEMEESEEKAE